MTTTTTIPGEPRRIQITNEHQALAAREAAEALRALAEEPERQGLVRGVALDACESLALRLDGAARTAVLAVRDRIWDNATTAEELRATAEAWELAAGCYEVDVGAEGWRGAGRRVDPIISEAPTLTREQVGLPPLPPVAFVALPTHYPAQHTCAACGRHPATHRAGGEDACGACGLGDDRVTPEELPELRRAAGLDREEGE